MQTEHQESRSQNANLQTRDEQIITLLNRVQKLEMCINDQRIPLLVDKLDWYFVERSLIELGYLRANKNLSAHTSFLSYLKDRRIVHSVRFAMPSRQSLSDGAALITQDLYPWRFIYIRDVNNYRWRVKRCRALYRVTHNLMKGLPLNAPVPQP